MINASIIKEIIMKIGIGNRIGRYIVDIYETEPEPSGDELLLTFNNISDAAALIGGNPNNVADWNTFFTIEGVYTGNFTSVEISGNVVNLIGGSDINISGNASSSLFLSDYKPISITDTLGNVIGLFINDSNLVNVPDLSGLSSLLYLDFNSSSISAPPDLSLFPKLQLLGLTGLSSFDITDIDSVLTFYGTLRENIIEVNLNQDPPVYPTPATLLAAQTANPQCTFYVNIDE